MKAPASGRPSPARELLIRRAPWVVALFALALHAPAWGGGFVLDDVRAVLGHPAVNGAAPWWEVFTRELWGGSLATVEWSSSYRPLTSLTFAIEHRLSSGPLLPHVVNGALYAALCGQVTWLAGRAARPGVALAVGLVFAALPIHVENVASIVGRADVLAVLAALGAFALAVPADGRPPRAGRLAGAAFLYICAVLCKESVALLPAVVAWVGLLAWRRDPGRTGSVAPSALRHLVAALVLGVVGAAYLIVRHHLLSVELPPDFVNADNQLAARAGFWRVWGDLAVLGHYAELTAVPLRLCADHTYGDVFPPVSLVGAGAGWAWLGLAIAIPLVADGVRALRGRSHGLWFAALLAYLLIGQWVISLSVIVAERIALWPTVWVAIALAASADRLVARVPLRRAAVLVGILVALAGARSVQRGLDWRDGRRLAESSVEACPAAVHGRLLLAMELARAGEVEQALWHRAVAIAGREAFPGPFEGPVLDAEQTLPLAERLRALPELMGARDRAAFWRGLEGLLERQGARGEAALVRRLAAEPPPVDVGGTR